MAASSQRARQLLRTLAPAIMPAAYVAFTLLVFWQVWTPIENGSGFWRFDPRYEYWGDLSFQVDSLRDGHLALWNPYDRGGFPIYGDPQPGLLYPGNWPLIGWGLVTGGAGYMAIGVKIMAHWAFGAIGMHLLLRRLRAPEPACYVAGTLFAWTCPKMRYGGSALNWSVAWLPWILLGVRWFADKPSTRRAIILGTVSAMPLLTGAPAVVLYALVLTVPFLLYEMRGRLRASLTYLAIAAGVALLWVIPLVASNLEQIPESVRETRNLWFVSHSEFQPADFINFVVPRIGGENVYYGLFPLLCIGLLVGSAGRGRALVLLGIAAAGVALALGSHAGFMPATASAFPPFGLFRRAHRYLYITSTAVAILAGLGFAHALTLEVQERKRALARRVVWVGGAATFALAIAYLVSVVVHDKLHMPKNDAFGLAVLSAAVGTWLVRAVLVSKGKAVRAYAWIAVALLALDVWTASSKIVDGGMTPPPNPHRDATLAKLADVETEWRIYDNDYFEFRPGTRLHIRDFSGYEADPLGLARYKQFLDHARKNRKLLGHANVRYYLDGRGHNLPKNIAAPLGKGVSELTAVAPAVMYVPHAVRVDNPKQAAKALKGIEPGAGAVVEGAAPPQGPADVPVSAGRITVLEPNHLRAEIDTPGPGLIVIAEAYYPAWSATLDGSSAKVQPANLMFRGIPVETAGHHVIEMRIRPMRFWGLLPLYSMALGLLGWAVIGPSLARRRRRRRSGSSTPPRSDPPTEEESA